ncbi:MAG TPA: hypothetical protein DCR55_06600 [Lentisphaeria bacterium]|nr:hypothetical protein [Lentisphaeria bacterium]
MISRLLALCFADDHSGERQSAYFPGWMFVVLATLFPAGSSLLKLYAFPALQARERVSLP